MNIEKFLLNLAYASKTRYVDAGGITSGGEEFCRRAAQRGERIAEMARAMPGISLGKVPIRDYADELSRRSRRLEQLLHNVAGLHVGARVALIADLKALDRSLCPRVRLAAALAACVARTGTSESEVAS